MVLTKSGLKNGQNPPQGSLASLKVGTSAKLGHPGTSPTRSAGPQAFLIRAWNFLVITWRRIVENPSKILEFLLQRLIPGTYWLVILQLGNPTMMLGRFIAWIYWCCMILLVFEYYFRITGFTILIDLMAITPFLLVNLAFPSVMHVGLQGNSSEFICWLARNFSDVSVRFFAIEVAWKLISRPLQAPTTHQLAYP